MWFQSLSSFRSSFRAKCSHACLTTSVCFDSDQQSLKSAQEAIAAIRRSGVRVAVLASRSPLQALSAISTHNEDADYDDEIVEIGGRVEKIRVVITHRSHTVPQLVPGLIELMGGAPVTDVVGIAVVEPINK